MPLEIDDRFVDVDFARVARDEGRFLGCAGPGSFELCGSYEQEVPTIPESDWERLTEELDAQRSGADYLVTRIYDQDGEGSCVANACCQAHEIVQARQVGKDAVIQLSAMSLYKRIGIGPNSGAMVSDGLEELTKRGALPLDTPENRARFGEAVMENCGWRNRWPSDWEATAKKFCAVEAYVVRSVAGLMTALLRREPVVVGRAGHSICYTRPAIQNGRLGVVYVNSWGSWGFGAGGFQNGFGFDSPGMVRSSAGWAFVLRSVKAPVE